MRNLEIFAMRISLQDIFATLKMRDLREFPTIVNDRVILPFREGFIFAKLRIREVLQKYNLRENFQIHSYVFYILLIE